MSKFEKYSSYKDSGIQWLGEVPEYWELIKLKYITKINQESLPETTSKNSVIKYVDIGSVSFENGIVDYEKFTFKNSPSRARRKAEAGDTIVSTVRTYLKAIDYINAEKSNYIFSTGFAIIHPNKSIHPLFLTNVIRSNFFTNQVDINSKGMSYPAINSSDLAKLYLLRPPKEEQVKIANFLDKTTAQIDEAIKQKEELINLLKERRQVLIHKAVTQGLDATVKMKDSGVEWIGQVPEHWEVEKVKYIFNLIIDPAPNNNNFELLSIYTDIGVKPRKDLVEKGNKASTTDGYWKVRKGDFIVNKLLAWMGAVGLSAYDGVTSPAYDILRAINPIEGIYFHELFRMNVFSQEMKKHSRGIMDMRLRLYFDKFGDIRVPLPPIEEQKEIVKYIKLNSDKIENTISLQEKQIEKIKEYKATLIDSVVTGKAKVI